MWTEVFDKTWAYIESTLFYFVECTKPGVIGVSATELSFTELRVMLFDDICATYNFTPKETQDFLVKMSTFISFRVKRLASKQFQGGEGSRFMMHTIIFPKEGADPDFHPADKISVTAGCGRRNWEQWTNAEQTDIQDFMFDLNDKTGSPYTPVEIKLKENRLTAVVTVRDMVKN